MDHRIALEREQDGQWIAEVIDIPGVTVCGNSKEKATLKAQALAFRILAEKIHFREVFSMPPTISFLAARRLWLSKKDFRVLSARRRVVKNRRFRKLNRVEMTFRPTF
jgi:predicted RNase H-like HicB family nuclease